MKKCCMFCNIYMRAIYSSPTKFYVQHNNSATVPQICWKCYDSSSMQPKNSIPLTSPFLFLYRLVAFRGQYYSNRHKLCHQLDFGMKMLMQAKCRLSSCKQATYDMQ